LLLIDHVGLDEDEFPAAVQRCMLMNYGTGRGSQFDDLLSRFVSSSHDDACSFDVFSPHVSADLLFAVCVGYMFLSAIDYILFSFSWQLVNACVCVHSPLYYVILRCLQLIV